MGDHEHKAFVGDDVRVTQDGLVFDPYNDLNKEITLNDVQSILTRYGVPGKVENLNLYQRAFVHRSYTKRPQLENEAENITIAPRPASALPLRTKSNERLEFLGDGVLECITKYYLYKRFPKENEGFMTEKKIALVKNEAIGRLAMEMKLNNWVLLSRNAEEKKTRTNLKKLGCIFESFLGALFLDFNKITIKDEENWFGSVFSTGPGFQMAQIFVENIFERHVNWTDLINNDDNYKNILQVKIQKEFKITPDYLELGWSAETGYRMGLFICIGQPIYSVASSDAIKWDTFGSMAAIHSYVEEHGKVLVYLAESEHKIKKKAEQEACELALKKI
jgi:dsRNA-specific ribonuclease